MGEVRPEIEMMETGGWGGIHYYAYGLCDALAGLPVELVLLTNEQYELKERPHRFERVFLFRREPYLRTLWKLVRRWRGHRPDILHVQSFLALRKDVLLFLLCKVLGIRVVLTVHNVLPHERLMRFEVAFHLLYFWLADALVLHSEENRSRLLEKAPRLNREKVFVIPHGNYAHFRDLELEKAAAREQLGLPQDRRIALFFGTVRPYKGLDLLLEAVGPVRRVCPEALFVAAGYVVRWDRVDYERKAASLGLGPEDVLLRFQYLSTAEAIAYVCACDLVVLPYRHIYQSGVLFWAYSFGRPVLATRVGSFPESIEEGRSGWLVAPEDVEELQGVLAKVLQEPEKLATAGRFARDLADTRFGWEGIARQTLGVYKWVMGGARA